MGENERISALLEELLYQAVNDYVIFEEGRKRYEQAFIWFSSDSNCEMTDFCFVCEHFSLSPDRFRYLLNEWKDKKRSKAAWRRQVTDEEFSELMTQCQKEEC